ncbi:MAG: N-6 DNA methylase, partial [Patescibacteria group bacterium]|nr:N-6 DNA methylase [Patescibacteria group bacterium]
LTNPPFGTKGAGGAPSRDDFLVSTANKQLNFVQHAMTILKQGGQAAIVVPDNVLFESSGKRIRENLMKSCDLHTILRLPEGTFSPYSAGVRANVIFFTKGQHTKETWIYDLRTNIDNINKGNPLTDNLFEEFEKCYSNKPRKEIKRFRKYTKEKIEERDYNLDIIFLKDTNLEENDKIPKPNDIVNEIKKSLKTALDAIDELTIKFSKTSKY